MNKPRPTSSDKTLWSSSVASLLGVKIVLAASAMRQAGVTERVTLVQAQQWKNDPASAPEWLTALLAEKAVQMAEQLTVRTPEWHRQRKLERKAANRVRQEQAQERKNAKHRADMVLCPEYIPRILCITRRELLVAMRVAGITEPPTKTAVTNWSEDHTNAPEWFTHLLAQREAEEAERLRKNTEEIERWRKIEEKRANRVLPEYTVVYRPAGTHEMRECTVSATGPQSVNHERAGLCDGDVIISVRGKNGEWPRYLSTSMLRNRGWVPSMIRDFLGEHDKEWINPHYSTAARVKAYRASRVLVAEDLPIFAELAVKGAKHSAASKRGAEKIKSLKILGDAVDAVFTDETVFEDGV